MKTEFKIRIIQPIVPEYRVALFEGVGRRYPGRVELWAADGFNGQDVSLPISSMKTDYTHSFVRFGPFQWQRCLSLEGLRRGDVLVACGDVHNLAMMFLALCAKMRGIKVVWWGHHWTASSKPFSVRIRLIVAKFLSDVYLCYTRTGIKYLESRGFRSGRVFATGNTINQEPIKKAIEYWNGSRLVDFQERHGIVGKNMVVLCSVLRTKTRLGQLIEALSDPKLNDVLLAVIGDGPIRDECVELAKRKGVDNRIFWVGATRDQQVMAPWFMSSKAFVYPGPIGLSIIHSMSYGVPVVAHNVVEHQMPEFEIMENGRTGLCFVENDVADLVARIADILADEPRRRKMAEYSQRAAFEKYSMNQMVENFCAAVEAAREGAVS